MLPENHAFLPKMSILLILNTYTLHRYLCILQVWRQKYFISNVLGLASLNQDQNSMGYCFNKTGVARKSCLFTLNDKFCLGPIAKYMHFREKSSVFYEFDDKNISFLHVLNVSLNYDQKTLGYRFSEWWCCQKIMPLYLKYQFCLGL